MCKVDFRSTEQTHCLTACSCLQKGLREKCAQNWCKKAGWALTQVIFPSGISNQTQHILSSRRKNPKREWKVLATNSPFLHTDLTNQPLTLPLKTFKRRDMFLSQGRNKRERVSLALILFTYDGNLTYFIKALHSL